MDLIRIGRVSTVYPDRCTARVVYEDKQGQVSGELQISQRGDYWLPKIGQDVIILKLSNANSDGFIIGDYYNADNKPTVADINKRYITFEDGVSFEYDAKLHQLTLDFSNVSGANVVLKNCELITDSGSY